MAAYVIARLEVRDTAWREAYTQKTRIGKRKPLFSPRAVPASPVAPARLPRSAAPDGMLGATAPGINFKSGPPPSDFSAKPFLIGFSLLEVDSPGSNSNFECSFGA